MSGDVRLIIISDSLSSVRGLILFSLLLTPWPLLAHSDTNLIWRHNTPPPPSRTTHSQSEQAVQVSLIPVKIVNEGTGPGRTIEVKRYAPSDWASLVER